MQNKVMTFIENKDKKSNKFIGDEHIFSIPYKNILEAEDYCKREQIDFCYVGFRNNVWLHADTHENFIYYVKVTQNGVLEENYLYEIKDLNS